MSQAAELLQGRAEVLKLARLLGRGPDDLAYLEQLPPEELKELRNGVTEALYDDGGGSLSRLAAVSRILPAGLTATISQHAFGPLLSARLAGMMEPARAVDVAAKLPPPFLADIAVEMDPRRASDLLASMPPALIADVTRELAQRGEHVTMGRFVGHLHDDAVAAALGAMDDRTLLQVAFVLEDRGQLGHLLTNLPRRRVAGIIDAAAHNDLWVEALDLLNHVSPRQRREMVTTAVALEEDSREKILAAVIEHELWDEAVLIAEYDPTLQTRLVERLREMPARRRRKAAARARERGILDRLGVVGQALGGS